MGLSELYQRLKTVADSPVARRFSRAVTKPQPRPPMLRSRPTSVSNRFRPAGKSNTAYQGKRRVGRPSGPTGMYRDPKTGQPVMAYQYYAIQRKMASKKYNPEYQEQNPQQVQQMPQQQMTPQQMQQMQIRQMQMQQQRRMTPHDREKIMRRMQMARRMQQTAEVRPQGVQIQRDIMTGRPIIRQLPNKERWLQ